MGLVCTPCPQCRGHTDTAADTCQSSLSHTLPSEGFCGRWFGWSCCYLQMKHRITIVSTFGTFVSSFQLLVTASTGPVYAFLSHMDSAVFTLRSTCQWLHCQLAFLHTIQASSMNGVCVCACVRQYASLTHLLSSTSSLALIDTFTLGKVV